MCVLHSSHRNILNVSVVVRACRLSCRRRMDVYASLYDYITAYDCASGYITLYLYSVLLTRHLATFGTTSARKSKITNAGLSPYYIFAVAVVGEYHIMPSFQDAQQNVNAILHVFRV